MSSDMYLFDNSFYSALFPDSPTIHALPHFPLQIIQQTEQAAAADDIDLLASALLLSSSPPSAELRNLSLSQQLSASENKTEECHVGFPSNSSFSPHETALKLMQRSYSSNSFENSPNFSFRPHFHPLLDSRSLHNHQISNSPESTFPPTQMRRVFSTGDLQNMQTRTPLSSSPLSADKSFMEEANFKVGRYSAQDRKERIDRYRAKRTQRNFNKTIKYACRKTLADTRPRIRGRFVRNEEAGEIPKASRYEDDDDDHLWMSLQMEGLHEEDIDDKIARNGTFFDVSDCNTQYHNFRSY